MKPLVWWVQVVGVDSQTGKMMYWGWSSSTCALELHLDGCEDTASSEERCSLSFYAVLLCCQSLLGVRVMFTVQLSVTPTILVMLQTTNGSRCMSNNTAGRVGDAQCPLLGEMLYTSRWIDTSTVLIRLPVPGIRVSVWEVLKMV